MIKLVEITPSYTDYIVKWRSNPRVSEMFFSKSMITKASHLQWLSSRPDNEFNFIISTDDKPIGAISLYNITDNKAEFGRFYIGDDYYLGKGYGREALKELLRFGFSLGVNSIYAYVLAENIIAIKLYLSLGFKIIKDAASVKVVSINRNEYRFI